MILEGNGQTRTVDYFMLGFSGRVSIKMVKHNIIKMVIWWLISVSIVLYLNDLEWNLYEKYGKKIYEA